MYIISGCLLGHNCKYNGGNNRNEDVIRFCEEHEYLVVCPERAGNLPTPRPPAEKVGNGKRKLRPRIFSRMSSGRSWTLCRTCCRSTGSPKLRMITPCTASITVSRRVSSSWEVFPSMRILTCTSRHCSMAKPAVRVKKSTASDNSLKSSANNLKEGR